MPAPGGRDRIGRRRGVDRDAVVVQFGGKAFRQPVQRRLDRAVDAEARRAIELGERRPGGQIAADRRQVEHPAAAALAHRGNGQLGQVQRREHVHLHHQPHALLREPVERPQERDGGVVDQDVGRADAFDHLGEQPLAVLGDGQIGLNGDRRCRLRPRISSSV